MKNDIFFVDPVKVAKQAKSAGEFMMMQCNSGNLLLSGQFLLSLSDEQFFSVRCKLEIPMLETWYMQSKKELIRSERQSDVETWESRYNEFINAADPRQQLTNTIIELQGCYLYTDGMTYTAIRQDRIDMLQYSDNLRRADSMVVVDGTHVVAPVSETVWKKNDWLKRLPGMVEVD